MLAGHGCFNYLKPFFNVTENAGPKLNFTKWSFLSWIQHTIIRFQWQLKTCWNWGRPPSQMSPFNWELCSLNCFANWCLWAPSKNLLRKLIIPWAIWVLPWAYRSIRCMFAPFIRFWPNFVSWIDWEPHFPLWAPVSQYDNRWFPAKAHSAWPRTAYAHCPISQSSSWSHSHTSPPRTTPDWCSFASIREAPSIAAADGR